MRRGLGGGLGLRYQRPAPAAVVTLAFTSARPPTRLPVGTGTRTGGFPGRRQAALLITLSKFTQNSPDTPRKPVASPSSSSPNETTTKIRSTRKAELRMVQISQINSRPFASIRGSPPPKKEPRIAPILRMGRGQPRMDTNRHEWGTADWSDRHGPPSHAPATCNLQLATHQILQNHPCLTQRAL